MPQPTGRQLRVDAVNTAMLVGYRNLDMIADLIFPYVGVNKRSGIIPQLKQSQFFRDLATKRVSGTKARRSGYETDLTMTYFADRYSHGVEVYDEDRDDAAEPFKLDQLASMKAADVVALKREVLFAASFFAASKGWTDKTAGVDFQKWDDYVAGLPLVDIDKFKDEVEGKIGKEPDTLVIGKATWPKWRWNPQLVDTIKHTQRGTVSLELAAELMGLRRILVGRAIYTTDPEGTAEASVTYTRVWGKNALLLHAPQSIGQMIAPAGVRVVWERVPSAQQYIRRIRDEELECDVFEGNCYVQFKQVVGRAGIFLPTITN